LYHLVYELGTLDLKKWNSFFTERLLNLNKMKIIRFIVVVGIALVLMVVACKRTSIERNGEIQPKQEFANLKTSDQFSWNTNASLQIQFLGKQNDPRIAAFKILDEKGEIYFQKLQKANESFTSRIQLPAHIQNLQWSFAGQNLKFNAKAGKIVVVIQP
jgi:hypothetical protein